MSESMGLSIAVIGATGAVGGDLVAALPKSGLPVRELRLFAGPGSVGRVVEHGEQLLPVRSLGPDPGASAELDGLDLAFLAVPPEVARALGPALAARGVMVVELGGALADRAPLVVPALGRDPLAEAARERLVSSPSAPAVLVATLLGALAPFEPEGCSGSIQLSAGAAGKAGIEELSGQVVAMFNQKDPPRRVFPAGLAFDLLPGPGAIRPAADPLAGWSEGEIRLAAELGALTERPASRFALSLQTAPYFAGLVASLVIELANAAPLRELEAALDDAPGVHRLDPVPGPKRVVGRASLFAGRLRLDPEHPQRLHLLAVADNLRFGASANALALAAALWEEGRI